MLAAALALIVVVAVAALLYARRAGLYAAALERQLQALRDQFAAYRKEDQQSAAEAEDRLEQRLKEALRGEATAPIQAGLGEIAAETRGHVDRLGGEVGALADRTASLAAQMTGAAARIEKIAEAAEIV